MNILISLSLSTLVKLMMVGQRLKKFFRSIESVTSGSCFLAAQWPTNRTISYKRYIGSCPVNREQRRWVVQYGASEILKTLSSLLKVDS